MKLLFQFLQTVYQFPLLYLFIRVLIKLLERTNDDEGVRTMKKVMLKSLNRRFSDGEDKKSLVLATLLDHRFNFSSLVKSLNAKTQLRKK